MSAAPPPRLVSLDAYRGFIMLVMASSGLGLARISQQLEISALVASTVGLISDNALSAAAALFPGRTDRLPFSPLWRFLGFHFEHVPWEGCAFWDLIQPSFMFMVGVALPYSFASRQARGDSYGRMLGHAVWRALVLILLAVFLSSPGPVAPGKTPIGPTTNWVFTNVLAQIGLGYVFVFLLVGRGLGVQLLALFAILAGSTLLFALWPVVPSDYDWKAVGVPEGWPLYSGWFAHWNKNANAAHFFDLWFLNLFPHQVPFRYNAGGYQTLNFIPSMATMLLGLIAGERLRGSGSPASKLLWLVMAALLCLAVGWLMGQWVCPIVKRIWTPSWAVYSAGWTLAMLAAFYAIIDVVGWRSWSFPLVVVGMNSIAMYLLSQQLRPWVRRNLHVHFGREWFVGDYGPLIETSAILFVLWLICLWLYRRGIFLRI